MVNGRAIWNDLKANKEGILIGALVGLGATLWARIQGADLTFAVVNAGILDSSIASISGLGSLAITKVGIALIALGATIGYLVDSMIAPRK